MPTKITITLKEDLTQDEQEKLQWIFKDAFGEFRVARSPVEEYVAKRYDYLQDDKRISDKIAYVEGRLSLVAKILRGVSSMFVEITNNE